MAKKTKIDIIIEELQNASKMHLRQSKELASHAKDMDKGSPANKNYNEVNVQDLQDLGEVKKDSKKRNYVVNERLTNSKADTLYIPKGTKSYTGKKIKVGSLIDESDYENLSSQANNPINKNKPGEILDLPKSTMKGGNIGALGGVSKAFVKVGKAIASSMISPIQPRDEVKASKYAKATKKIKPFETSKK
tara:strand:+ start:628 stop:1200 length:573 start_codon:yes stop_codon:yes gene_type:complete